MTKEDFKILMNALYSNSQLFITAGTNINDWIDNSYVQSEAKDKEIEDLKEQLKAKEEENLITKIEGYEADGNLYEYKTYKRLINQ